MRAEVLQYYGRDKPFNRAGYYETEYHKQLFQDIKAAILEGKLIAVCGGVGSGKTVTLRRLQQTLRDENRVLVSKSLSVEKSKTTLRTLISALFYDLSPDKQVRIPAQGERRERELRALVKKGKRPVALFVDEAHDLHGNTLTGLKRLVEVIEDGGGLLSVILAGHPKLRNDLRKPTMEEIGYRATIFSLDGVAGSQQEYIQWLLQSCTEGALAETILAQDAIDLFASKLRTPLQVEQHLTLALEAGYQIGERPVSLETAESVLSKQLDDLEPTLTRHGYQLKDLADQFGARPAEIRALFSNQLQPERARELRERMLAAGLPL
jgi:type II secretory pathway predicted ATPase ExeA